MIFLVKHFLIKFFLKNSKLIWFLFSLCLFHNFFINFLLSFIKNYKKSSFPSVINKQDYKMIITIDVSKDIGNIKKELSKKLKKYLNN